MGVEHFYFEMLQLNVLCCSNANVCGRILPIASKADSRDLSVVPSATTLLTNVGMHWLHWLTGNSATATDATHCAADDGRDVSVPKACIILTNGKSKRINFI